MRFLKSGMACGLALAAFAVAAIAMFASVRTNEDIKLSIGTVRQGTVTPTATYSGSVDFGQSWDLLSPSSGNLKSVNVRLGDTVDTGSILVQFDTSAQTSEAFAARSRLANLLPVQRIGLNTERSLVLARQSKALSAIDAKLRALAKLRADGIADDLDQQVAYSERSDLLLAQRAELAAVDFKIAELNQEILEISVSANRNQKDIIRAPIRGIVTAMSVDPNIGDTVALGQHILTLVDDKQKILRFAVTQDQTAELVRNRAARCSLPRRAIVVGCELVGIAKIGDSFVAKFRFDGGTEFVRGEPGEVEIPTRAAVAGMTIPKSALRYRGGRLGVDVLRSTGRTFVSTTVLATGRDDLVVVGSLQIGEHVLVAG
jgi:multidrug efflux pump subunit AcrA (membrane-fusion protein)